MNKIALISDSSCNLNSKMQKELGIVDVLPMHITFMGKEYDCNGDWTMVVPKEYYNHMRNGEVGKSAQINRIQYYDSFKKFLDLGYDILSVSCTSGLSASVKESYKARDELQPLYPNQVIRCVDSANCTFSLAMILMKCHEFIEDGKTVDEIVKWIDENKLYYNEIGTVDKLTWLRMAGRVSASAAFFGGLLSVKPIVVYDEIGHNVAVEKVKGRMNSFKKIVEYLKKYCYSNKNNNIYIAHADCEEDAKMLSEMIQKEFEEKINFTIEFVEPGVGSSCGPGTLILSFYGNPDIRRLNK